MARKRKSARTSARSKSAAQQRVSWPGRVARRIKSGIKKLVG